MASTEGSPDGPDVTRRRDAARTRDALLSAAKELFGAKGYTRTTLRQIGERAGVDPALVARYFGSKTAIYIASLESDDPSAQQSDVPPVLAREYVDRMIERITSVGASPLLQAVVVPTNDVEVSDAARRIISERIIAPLLDEIAGKGLDRARLRAEIAFTALTGVMLARSAGTLETLAAADHADVLELTLRTIRPILEG